MKAAAQTQRPPMTRAIIFFMFVPPFAFIGFRHLFYDISAFLSSMIEKRSFA
jgi:hypothetical protein